MDGFKFSYNEEHDDLFVYREDSNSEGSVEFGDLVLDFDGNKNLVAMQISNASEFLSKFISEAINLGQIKSIDLETKNHKNIEVINFKISTEDKTYSSSIVFAGL